ncbi:MULTISPECIES: hypothetical protein [unclassified Lentilitoribacter]|uniref:hypothetical protein n=1 Tax=unclassified Lentilitoribacter TaxID=2647570 RepID=UPI0013A689C7|nr:hypothetical protein [Lentilitoribacter sp. Alg239-R112]
MSKNKDNITNDRRLSDVVRERRIVAAEREDVVIDMKEADKARLELLMEELEPLINDVDQEDDRFDFSISSGEQPRFWIDSVTHVHMGRDRRTFRFVRDSRLGRVVLAEDSDLKTIAGQIGNYVADRVIEREKIIEGDLEDFKDYYSRMTNESLGRNIDQEETDDTEVLIDEKRSQSGSASMVIAIIWFLIGGVLGLALTVNYYDEIIAFIQSV